MCLVFGKYATRIYQGSTSIIFHVIVFDSNGIRLRSRSVPWVFFGNFIIHPDSDSDLALDSNRAQDY